MNCHILYHDNCFDGACSAAVFMRLYLSRIDPGARFQLFGMAHQPRQTFPDHLFGETRTPSWTSSTPATSG